MRHALPARRSCVNLAAMDYAPTRRHILRLFSGAPLLVASVDAVFAAKTALIERLIQQARALPTVSQRIDFISGKLIGVRYQADTLIGSPTRPERFVVRDDAFDCVTFCEVVLAAAIEFPVGRKARQLGARAGATR